MIRMIGSFVALFAGLAWTQPVSTASTPTGYFYALGTTQFYPTCPNNGGTWLGRDAGHGGCYAAGFYHIGFDMFSASTSINSPVYALTTGTVIDVDTIPGSWSLDPKDPHYTPNGAVLILSYTNSGVSFITLYGHLLISSILVQKGDVVTGGTRIGLIGNWYPPHVHIGVWPNTSSLPPIPWGREPNSQWGIGNYTNGTTDPLRWITSSNTSPRCQNGGTVRYKPNGNTPVHPTGTLFTLEYDPHPGTVYVLYQGQARPITKASVLYALYGTGRGFDFRDVIQISAQEFATYPLGSAINSPLVGNGKSQPDGRLIAQWGGSEISIVTNKGYRRPFVSANAFLNLGYQYCNVAGVSDYFSYPTLSPITQ